MSNPNRDQLVADLERLVKEKQKQEREQREIQRQIKALEQSS